MSEARFSGAILSQEARQAVAARTDVLLGEHRAKIARMTDRMFAVLLAVEWMAAVIWALARSPWTWEGAVRHVHPHVWQAIVLGGLAASLPIYMVLTQVGTLWTRQIIAVCQMLISALLIHVSGGRIETHFHVFGSLAFLAFYRDWRVLATATVVVAADHMLRNLFLPESVFGVVTASPWRWLEHAAWVVFEDIILIAACERGVSEMRGIAEQRALLERSHDIVEEQVQQRTEQLRQAQDELVNVARQAGMAEIATSVLHNVGNVLNSVNVSVQTATTTVQGSPVDQLAAAVEMVREHKTDLGTFLERDERGRMIPEFLEAVSEALCKDQSEMLAEMRSLAKNVDHIKEIVHVQQSHAKVTELRESVRLKDLIEDAIKVTMLEGERAKIAVERLFGVSRPMYTDRHAILQILINVFSNAKHALMELESDRRLVVECGERSEEEEELVYVRITDNGVGIEPANLTKIFHHGFTTKKDGHGFGLHASANFAKRLGGSLTAESEGVGKGATFYFWETTDCKGRACFMNTTAERRRILVIVVTDAIHGDFRKTLESRTPTERLGECGGDAFGKDKREGARGGRRLMWIRQLAGAGEGFEKVKGAAGGRGIRLCLLAFVDMRMPPGWDGVETVKHLWEADPELQVVICTAYSDYSWEQITDALGTTDRLLILKKPFDPIEVCQLAAALSEKWKLKHQAALKMSDLEKMVHSRTAELQRLAMTDKLTGLPNRAYLLEQLKSAVAKTVGDAGYRFAVHFLDFDRFKVINDSLGHNAGDQLLIGIAERLTKVLDSGKSGAWRTGQRLRPGVLRQDSLRRGWAGTSLWCCSMGSRGLGMRRRHGGQAAGGSLVRRTSLMRWKCTAR